MFGFQKKVNKWEVTANKLIDFCCGEIGVRNTILFLHKECKFSRRELKNMGFEKSLVDYLIFNMKT